MNTYAYIITSLGSTFIDYPDNESIAVVVYFLGCEHRCYLCHNEDFQLIVHPQGMLISCKDLFTKVKEKCDEYKTNKVVFSGGDPLHHTNIDCVREFLNRYCDYFKVCIYTGYDIDFVKKNYIKNFTFIKCGGYNHSLSQYPHKTNEFIQFSSSNQKLYNSSYNLLSVNGRYYFN